jgi:sugar lactone lactonase YvrE
VSRKTSLFAIVAVLLITTILLFVFLTGKREFSSSKFLSISKKIPAATVLGWAAQLESISGENISGSIDGPIQQARFSDPFGVVLDKQGNIYVADGGENNTIRKITPEGVMTSFAGSKEGYVDGVAANAAFNTPSGLAIDDAGNIYVADTANNVIRKITPQGDVSTLAGNGKAGFLDGKSTEAQFNGPIGVAVDKTGKVYVADTYNDRIRVITPDGQVSTVAGGAQAGYQDGAAKDALFDTPCSLVINSKGELLIADTRNNAIRKINNAGEVSTVVRSIPEDKEAKMKRPTGLALTHDDFLYVGELSGGRIFQISPAGETRGLTGIDIDISKGDDVSLRLQRPVGLALDKSESIIVTDASNFALRKVRPKLNNETAKAPAPEIIAALVPAVTGAPAAKTPSFPWPLKPQNQPHEVVGTIGEVRGNYDGEARDHFHSGLDIQAAMGAPVLAVADEKVSSPTAAWGAGGINEGLRVASMSYIHMRVGRDINDASIDPTKFQQLFDDKNKLAQIRIKRGTRFHVGDTVGTVNRMYHVHLNYSQSGLVVNPLSLSLTGFKDDIAPKIEGIQLFDQAGQEIRKKKQDKMVTIPKAVGSLSIVVDAFDQADGNSARRRLGLYQLGYQILNRDGSALPGFEEPRMNIEFNRLPFDDEAVKVAYFADSGITVHGSARTRFLYNVTNTVRDGRATSGFWDVKGMPKGDYLIRIFASDYAGNMAKGGRDLAVRFE